MVTQESVIEGIQKKYDALPTKQKQTEFVSRWQSHINDLNRLLWSCKDTAEYDLTTIEVRRIQEQLIELVKRLSHNVK